MSPQEDRFTTKVACSSDSLAAGDSCRYDELQASTEYLDGNLTAQEAATKTTAPVLAEQESSNDLYRLWGLLSDVLVELDDDDRGMVVQLLSAIQALPFAAKIDWFNLRDLRHMWTFTDCISMARTHGNIRA